MGVRIAIVLGLVAAFGYGALVERYNLFPRPLIVAAAKSFLGEQTEPVMENSRTVETVFADIRFTSWPIDGLAGLGAIDTVGNSVIGTDRLGNFFFYRRGESEDPTVERLQINLETGYDGFSRHAEQLGLDVQHAWFRVHDILVDREHDRLFVSHHVWDASRDCSVVRISAAPLSRSVASTFSIDESDWAVLFESTPCIGLQTIGNPFEGLQAGGRLALQSPDELLVTIGDHGLDGWGGTDDHPQDPDSSYGKVWRIDVDTLDAQMISLGHRNPAGLLIDRRNRIWITEHGPRGGDELNLIREGANYGWPEVTYGTQYEHYGQEYYAWPRSTPEEQGRHFGYERAAYVWVDSIGVSNLIQVDSFLPAWDGDLLVASLGGAGAIPTPF